MFQIIKQAGDAETNKQTNSVYTWHQSHPVATDSLT